MCLVLFICIIFGDFILFFFFLCRFKLFIRFIHSTVWPASLHAAPTFLHQIDPSNIFLHRPYCLCSKQFGNRRVIPLLQTHHIVLIPGCLHPRVTPVQCCGRCFCFDSAGLGTSWIKEMLHCLLIDFLYFVVDQYSQLVDRCIGFFPFFFLLYLNSNCTEAMMSVETTSN